MFVVASLVVAVVLFVVVPALSCVSVFVGFLRAVGVCFVVGLPVLFVPGLFGELKAYVTLIAMVS